MNWFSSKLYKAFEFGEYAAAGGLGTGAIVNAVQGDYRMAAFEGILALFFGAFGYSTNRSRKTMEALEADEKLTYEKMEIMDNAINEQLAEIDRAIDNIGKVPEK